MNWAATSDLNHHHALPLRDSSELDRLDAIFEQDWSLDGGAARPPGRLSRLCPVSGIRSLLASTLAFARIRIEAEVFALTDPQVLMLLAAEAGRGVRVRVLLDPNQDVNRPSS